MSAFIYVYLFMLIRLLFMPALFFTALIEPLIKKYLCDSNFEMHFFREQFLNV